jgi:hypothetical protein
MGCGMRAAGNAPAAGRAVREPARVGVSAEPPGILVPGNGTLACGLATRYAAAVAVLGVAADAERQTIGAIWRGWRAGCPARAGGSSLPAPRVWAR